VDGRLNLDGEIGEMLKAFFGAYQFNQAFIEHGNRGMVADYEASVHDQFQPTFKLLKTLFDERIGDILKIRDNFSVEGKNNPFSNEQTYYNSFFIIGSRIVTSSSILDNMIESIKNSITGKTTKVLSVYEMSKP
jgi:hypothetical protein